MKKYALIILNDLSVRQFQFRDELNTAIGALQDREIGFVVVKWHDGIKQYVQPERAEW